MTFSVIRPAIIVSRSVTSLKTLIWPILWFEQVVSLTGKIGEELLHEVAARYVEGMKDMDGRKPGPSSIWGETKASF